MKLLYFLLILLIVVYPNKLLEGTYVNFIIIYIIYFIQFLFVNKQKNEELSRHKNYSMWLLVAIFIVVLIGCLISLIYTSYVGENILVLEYVKAIFRYLSYVLLFAILCNATRTRKDFNFIVAACLITYIISLIVVVMDSFKMEFIEEIFKAKPAIWLPDSHFRAFGAYLSPISVGIFIMNALIVIITYLLEKKNISKATKILLYLVIGLSLFCLLASASRTGLVGVLIIFLLILYKSKNKISFIVVFIILFIITIQTGLLDTHIDNIIRRNAEQSSSTNILEGSGRYDTFIHSIDLTLGFRTLFFGVGLPEYALGDGQFSLAHNGFLSIILCFGCIGFAVFAIYTRQLLVNEKNNKFNNLLVKRFLIVNLISFISSDGPVTHYWYVFLVFFIYYITYNNINSTQEIDEI